MRPLLLTGAAAWALIWLTVAWAHAEPARITPGDGAVVTAPPSAVVIEMSQEMARSAGANDIDVFDVSGLEVTPIAAVIDNGDRRRLSVVLPSTLAPGAYTVKWRSLSADDGDTAEGELHFTYDPGASPDPGREVLREDVLGPDSAGGSATDPLPTPGQGSGEGLSWVVLVSVALGSAVTGAGAVFLLVDRRR